MYGKNITVILFVSVFGNSIYLLSSPRETRVEIVMQCLDSIHSHVVSNLLLVADMTGQKGYNSLSDGSNSILREQTVEIVTHVKSQTASTLKLSAICKLQLR